MKALFAAAGLAEAAWAFDLTICWAALLFIAGITIAACIMNSWKLSLLAISLLLLFSLTFAPWAAFEPIRPDPDGLFDMEVVAWSARFKTMATFWGIEAAATIASLLWAR